MTILKRQFETTTGIAFITGVLVCGVVLGVCFTFAFQYLRKLWLTRQRNVNLGKLNIASRSSIVLPEISSQSLVESVNAEVIQRRGSLLLSEPRQVFLHSSIPAENDIDMISMTGLPDDLTSDSYIFNIHTQKVLDSSLKIDNPELPESNINNDGILNNSPKNLKVFSDEQIETPSTEVRKIDSSFKAESHKSDDSAVCLPTRIITGDFAPKSLKSSPSSINSESESLRLGESKSNSSSSTTSPTDDSPLGMLLRTEYGT